jgi:hypothetical protein
VVGAKTLTAPSLQAGPTFKDGTTRAFGEGTGQTTIELTKRAFTKAQESNDEALRFLV